MVCPGFSILLLQRIAGWRLRATLMSEFNFNKAFLKSPPDQPAKRKAGCPFTIRPGSNRGTDGLT